MSKKNIVELNVAHKITNPFIRDKIVLDDDLEPTRINLLTSFPNVIILSKMTNDKLPNCFYESSVPADTFKKYKNKLILSKIKNSLILNPRHADKMVVLDSSFLSQFNHFDIELDDVNLVLPIFDISFLNLQPYLKQYDGKNTLDDVVKMIVLNLYLLPYKNELIADNFLNIIFNMQESQYWTLYYNCKLNITNQIKDRNFNFVEYISRNNNTEQVKQIKSIIEEQELKVDNYMQLIYKANQRKWVDASNAITKGGRRCYRISKIPCNYTNSEINNIFNQLKSLKERYYFFNALLISKKYCHLVLNNQVMLEKMQPLFIRYAPLYRYLFGYAWLRFILEENIKKSFITHEDEFIFDIHTANKLPWFPFSLEDPTLNPYFPLLVNKNAIDTKNNIGGVRFKKVNDLYHYGITTLPLFRKRLNIFISSNSSKDYFNNITWDNIAITGSAMPACLLKNPVLLDFFDNVKYNYTTTDMNNTDFKYHRYFNEYYTNSDIDIMVNINDTFKFVDRVFKFYEEICTNIVIYNNEAKNSNVILTPIKKTMIILNDHFIKNNLVSEKHTFDYIVSNLNKDDAIIELIMPFYNKEKHRINQTKLKDIKEANIENILEKYEIYFKFFALENRNEYDNITLLYVDSRSEYKLTTENINCKSNSTSSDDELDTKDELFIVKDNIKFKMMSPYMTRNFEIFSIKYENFFSSVAKFHLPCVRAYYNGTNVYMTPTCISSYMTYTNINYKYFAGTNDPIEIINKYRMRGFGTILNTKEKNHLLHYSFKIDKWKKLYGINGINKKSRASILGNLIMGKHRFLQPLLFSEQVLYPLPYNTINTDDKISTIEDINNFYKNISGCKSNLLTNIHFINEYGYVKPLNKSFIKLIETTINNNNKNPKKKIIINKIKYNNMKRKYYNEYKESKYEKIPKKIIEKYKESKYKYK